MGSSSLCRIFNVNFIINTRGGVMTQQEAGPPRSSSAIQMFTSSSYVHWGFAEVLHFLTLSKSIQVGISIVWVCVCIKCVLQWIGVPPLESSSSFTVTLDQDKAANVNKWSNEWIMNTKPTLDGERSNSLLFQLHLNQAQCNRSWPWPRPQREGFRIQGPCLAWFLTCTSYYTLFHSLYFNTFHPLQVAEKLEPIPADLRRMYMALIHRRNDKQPFTPMGNLE